LRVSLPKQNSPETISSRAILLNRRSYLIRFSENAP
jgi:hypothetical protein